MGRNRRTIYENQLMKYDIHRKALWGRTRAPHMGLGGVLDSVWGKEQRITRREGKEKKQRRRASEHSACCELCWFLYGDLERVSMGKAYSGGDISPSLRPPRNLYPNSRRIITQMPIGKIGRGRFLWLRRVPRFNDSRCTCQHVLHDRLFSFNLRSTTWMQVLDIQSNSIPRHAH